jgi:hypothetical protein
MPSLEIGETLQLRPRFFATSWCDAPVHSAIQRRGRSEPATAMFVQDRRAISIDQMLCSTRTALFVDARPTITLSRLGCSPDWKNHRLKNRFSRRVSNGEIG